MTRSLPDDVSDDIKRLNPDLYPTAQTVRDSTATGHGVEAGKEAELQRDVEKWLESRGYWRRTPDSISPGFPPPKGWQVHIHQAKRNPILLDILLLSHDGRYIEIELKTRSGKLKKHQVPLVESDNGRLARCLEDAQKVVLEWEEKV